MTMGKATSIRAASADRRALFENDDLVAMYRDPLVAAGADPAMQVQVVTPPAGPNLTVGLLLGPEGQWYAAIVMGEVEGMYAHITSRFADGTSLTTTSMPFDEGEVDPDLYLGGLVEVHAGDLAATLAEGSVLVPLTAKLLPEVFAEDETRLLERAWAIDEEGASEGWIQETLSNDDFDGHESATRLTAYTDEAILSREFLDSLLAWLARRGLVIEQINDEPASDYLDGGDPADERWAEIAGDGEALLEGSAPVPWQAYIDAVTYSPLLVDATEAQLSPFEVTLGLRDEGLEVFDAEVLRQMTLELGALCGAIIAYCEPIDYGTNDYAAGLEAGAWLQLHGPRCLEHFGPERYGTDAPVAQIDNAGSYGRLVQLLATPTPTAELTTAGDAWAAHLGRSDLPTWNEAIRLASDDTWAQPPGEPWPVDDDDEEPLVDRRGVEGFSQAHHTLFLQAAPESVAALLAERRGSQARPVNPEQTADVYEDSLFVFRAAGHLWSGIVGSTGSGKPTSHLARELSARLGCAALMIFCDPSLEAVAYGLWQAGEPAEVFSYGLTTVPPGYDLPGEDLLPTDAAGPVDPSLGGLYFASALRESNVEEIDDPYAFVDHAFRIQDCYDPSWTFDELAEAWLGDPSDTGLHWSDLDALWLVDPRG